MEKFERFEKMALNSKAAVAAVFATVLIVSSTLSLAQSGGELRAAMFGLKTATIR